MGHKRLVASPISIALATSLLVSASVVAQPVAAPAQLRPATPQFIPAPTPQSTSAPQPVDDSISAYAATVDSVRLPDGRMLHFVCMGQGSPTVILTAGLGGDAVDWRKVQPQIAKATRVCGWDRPGFGLSDGSPNKQTVVTTTADLEAALGSMKPPYVMVGHSLGAFESLLYTDRNPNKVVGMVLVDPSWPDKTVLAFPPDERAQVGLVHLRKCADALRSGTLKPGAADPDSCFAFPTYYPAAWRTALSAKLSNPLQFESIASFTSSSDEDRPLAFNPRRDYGAMPMIVLSTLGQLIGQIGPDAAKSFVNPHEVLAKLSTKGVMTPVPGSGHYIQLDKPQAVIDAVDQVVDEARADMAKSRNH